MRSASDEELIGRFRSGKTEALDLLLRRYQDRVFQFVLWKTALSHAEAEDLTQDVFLQVVRSTDSFRGNSRFRTWLYAVAGNVCHRCIRTRSRRRKYLADGCTVQQEAASLEKADSKPDILEAMEIEERRASVRAAVSSLESNFQVVLLLRDWEELSYGEIAEVLDIAVGTVKSRVHNARLKLAETLVQSRQERC